MSDRFIVEPPQFDADSGTVHLRYRLGEHDFTETLHLPSGGHKAMADTPAFRSLLTLTALTLGVSYFKLTAPFIVSAPELVLTDAMRALVLDIYENGLGEFYARNDLQRFGRLTIEAPADDATPPDRLILEQRALLPIGGGKDSLVSVQLLEAAGVRFTPFAVNPKGPILTSVDRIGIEPLYVSRSLDREMIHLSGQPGYYNGHVPSTAINSAIAALVAVLFGYDRIVLSNERSAEEGNIAFDGREANHQYSKSLSFERGFAGVLAEATGGGVAYFSLLRPYSEARIARLFARETRFDDVFSSCNRNFRLSGHDGPLWCGECPKCHFVFLVLAPAMPRERLLAIFGRDLLDDPANIASIRELTGLAGQKPWECVGEILEAAACLHALAADPEWRERAVVRALAGDLLAQYGPGRLEAAMADAMTDSDEHAIPPALAEEVARHAV